MEKKDGGAGKLRSVGPEHRCGAGCGAGSKECLSGVLERAGNFSL